MKKILTCAVVAFFALSMVASSAMAGKGNGETPGGHGGGGFGSSDGNKGGVSGANGNQGNDKSVGNAGPEER